MTWPDEPWPHEGYYFAFGLAVAVVYLIIHIGCISLLYWCGCRCKSKRDRHSAQYFRDKLSTITIEPIIPADGPGAMRASYIRFDTDPEPGPIQSSNDIIIEPPNHVSDETPSPTMGITNAAFIVDESYRRISRCTGPGRPGRPALLPIEEEQMFDELLGNK